jgi:indolepyruvate ferredoxin oxidoreductase
VQEIIDYGLHAYAMSRFAGTWAAMKCVKDNIESTASVHAGMDRINPRIPSSTCRRAGSISARWIVDFLGQEDRLHRFKREAVGSPTTAPTSIDHVVWSGGA